VIIHQDNDWLAVDKPTGLATHAGKPGELGAVEWLALHLGLATNVISRLDRGTSGVLLLARHPAAAARAEEIHEAGTARKTYEFLAPIDSRRLGLPDTWQRTDELDGKTASTSFTRLGTTADGKLNHYRAELTRGRQHQIRRHAQLSGVPLLGDDQYGGAPFTRLCLHCATVKWPGLAAPLTAARPASFAALLGETPDDPLVAACHDRRGQWLSPVTDTFRAVHREEIADLPAAIDIYGSWFSAVWFDEDATADQQAARLDPVLAQVQARYGCRGGVVRTHRRNPHQRSLVTEVAVVGEAPPEVFWVTEHGLQYEINLLTTQHTGLFLDQRDTRRRLALRARGARLANLFAFTCSFSVAAVHHGAEVAFSVDTAKPCLATGMNNFSRNGLQDSGRGKFIREDVRKWVARQSRKRALDPAGWNGLDLIVCDPPVFASAGDGGQFSLEQEWPLLAAVCAELLAPDGAAIFANNHRTGDHRYYRNALAEVFDSVTDLRPPLDFPIQPGRPHHVRTFWCEQPASPRRSGPSR
jgi:23S rRNA (cytosine1962-C5)-methyltransferase